jgi:hypothetical protein
MIVTLDIVHFICNCLMHKGLFPTKCTVGYNAPVCFTYKSLVLKCTACNTGCQMQIIYAHS